MAGPASAAELAGPRGIAMAAAATHRVDGEVSGAGPLPFSRTRDVTMRYTRDFGRLVRAETTGRQWIFL